MTTRTVYLISARNTSFQRAHFSIFVPSASNPDQGTKIHAVGAPMAGYILEFKRNYNPSLEIHDQMFPIGQVSSFDIIDSPNAAPSIPTPGISNNFMAPVNDTNNKRCQEWTMEYVRYLVAKDLIGEEAIRIVESKRDPPTHGIGLRAVIGSRAI
ncbi:hypothetical protein N7475_004469 [Penicillium sp. IBT 31633x]|nr:hypothetical protein N7475_004469 [Penicillium sp. IBT 31633x]